MKEAYVKWWQEQTRKGDPNRSLTLTRDAFAAGYRAGVSTSQDLLDSLKELTEAMVSYEVGQDEPAPYKHRQMMIRVYTAITKAGGE